MGSDYLDRRLTRSLHLPPDARERIKAIERENRELRQANEILRKPSAYLAQAELDRRRHTFCARRKPGRFYQKPSASRASAQRLLGPWRRHPGAHSPVALGLTHPAVGCLRGAPDLEDVLTCGGRVGQDLAQWGCQAKRQCESRASAARARPAHVAKRQRQDSRPEPAAEARGIRGG